MNFWSKLSSDLFFQSPLSAADCLNILRDANPTYGDRLNPGCFEFKSLNDDRVLLVFKGKRFSKAMRTEYLLSLTDEPDGCTIALIFHKELLGMPPMTPAQDIALFMAEKLNATPKTTT